MKGKNQMIRHTACWTLAMGAALWGQAPPAPPAADPAPNFTYGGIGVSGIIDGYLLKSFNNPASGKTQLRNFDIDSNSFGLNMARMSFERAPEPLGFRFDMGFGKAFDIFQSSEPTTRIDTRYLMQGYVSAKPTGWKGFQMDFGKFYTSAGAEVTETHLNWNYSRALLYANGPYYHFGVRTTMPLHKNFTAGFQILNGWNNVVDNNSGKTFGFTGALTAGKVTWANNYYVGPEKTNTNRGFRNFWDTVLLVNANDKTSFSHISVLSRACESPGCSSASISIGV
ncbi:MAG: hypothetical protein FJW40_26055 [Acidobacteria bacterium]|nr:hypothetical protein [Acidobacteriota bacterium]